ncbi:MAG: response regulator transcription factor [Candidatus Omnitrophota bacterium]
MGKILLVDDDDVFRRLFIKLRGNYDFVEASSAEIALAILKKPNDIDLVLLDLELHGMSGIEALSCIRKQNPDLPVIILTAHGSQDCAVQALRGRADDFLEKGIGAEATEEVIARIIKSKQLKYPYFQEGVDSKIESSKDYIMRNYNRGVGLKDAARSVCMSPKYFSRIFKEKTGISFCDYKLKIRIEKAKAFLMDKDSTVDQVSDAVGYQNTESFIRQFKKIVHLTPAQYRKNFLEKHSA